jgi:hypothetical protein
MGAALPVIGTVASLISTGVSIYKAFNPPKIRIPEVKLPEEDLKKINSAIEANKQLSENARQAVKQAIELYKQGKLTPQYQAKLDEWWNKASTQLAQRLSSMGLSKSTIAETAYMELSQKYLSVYGNLLQAQLSDALGLTGISELYFNDLMKKSQLILQGKMSEAESYLTAMMASSGLAQSQGQALGGLSSAFSNLGDVFQAPSTTTSQGSTLGEL